MPLSSAQASMNNFQTVQGNAASDCQTAANAISAARAQEKSKNLPAVNSRTPSCPNGGGSGPACPKGSHYSMGKCSSNG